MASVPVYCLCKQVYDVTRFMIECDVCKDWFHGSCVGIREDQSDDVEEYHCPNCEVVHGPPKWKKKKNFHRHDYTEDYDPNKAVQAGTAVFLRHLKSRPFRKAEEIMIQPRGHELSVDFLDKYGFNTPMLVDTKEGLGLIVPPQTFTVSDVEYYVGSSMLIDVIDVRKQDEMKMTMKEWADYYTSPNRDKILNVISLEFSQTRLSDLVEPPRFVRKVSWVDNIWPDELPDDCLYEKPRVSKYCLMSVKDSYTDFHIDFGGTSVWYHVLRGEKIFYLVRPTEENLKSYEKWSSLSNSKQSEVFFGDQADICYKCVVKQGQTLCIPTGWIHAVLTTIDSLVFGGNFLHAYSIGLQIKVHELEKRVKTPPRFQFPWFEATMWYAASYLLDRLKTYKEEKRKMSHHIVSGVQDLCRTLKSWTNRKELHRHQKEIPETINTTKLLKELAKEVKLETPSALKKKDKKKTKKKMNNKQIEALENLHNKTKESLAHSNNTSHRLPSVISHPTPGTYRAQAQDKPSLKLRIPKVESFDQDTSTSSEDDRRKRKKKGGGEAKNPQMLKLVVSNGKIVSRGGSPVTVKSDVKEKGSRGEGKGENEDNEEINVDDITAEDIMERRRLFASQGSLKLRLSFNGKSRTNESSNHQTTTTSSDLDSDDDILPSDRSPRTSSSMEALLQATKAESLPSISLADIEAELKHQPASPGTQDAIQGMLSISLPGRSSTSPDRDLDDEDDDDNYNNKYSDDSDEKYNEDGENMAGLRRGTRKRRRKRYMDEIEDLPNCFQDAKYIYPTLDDDGDGPIFASRSKIPRKDQIDLPWNPKAKVTTPREKVVRPVRENVRKPNIETGLADAAARLANKPRPKRQYIRRKPLAPKKAAEPLEDIPSTSSALLAQSHDPYTFQETLNVEDVDLTQSAPANLLQPQTHQGPGRPPNKKPRKGMATAKQRLGKILKLGKKGRFT